MKSNHQSNESVGNACVSSFYLSQQCEVEENEIKRKMAFWIIKGVVQVYNTLPTHQTSYNIGKVFHILYFMLSAFDPCQKK